MEKTIYIMLSNTGTLFSKVIGMYTRKDMNHTSIAFDEQLNEMYSFGRKNVKNPFVGGFIKEDATNGLLKRATCEIYKCQVTTQEWEKMRKKICRMEQKKELYKYNLIGLFGVATNIKFERTYAFFCSQFVATIMNECISTRIHIAPCLVQPCHFEQLASLNLIYKGNLETYIYSNRTQGSQVRGTDRKKVAFQMLA